MCYSKRNWVMYCGEAFVSYSLLCIFSPVRNAGQPCRSFNVGIIEKMNCDVYGNESVGVFTILLSVSGEHKSPLQEHFCSAKPIKHLSFSLPLKLDLSKSCHLTFLRDSACFFLAF